MASSAFIWSKFKMENSFKHHGILGMKWGVRRYQPYPAGKRVAGGKEIGQAAKVQQRSSTWVSSKKEYKSGQTKRYEKKAEKERKSLERSNKLYDDLNKSNQKKIEKYTQKGNLEKANKYKEFIKDNEVERKEENKLIKQDIAKAEAKAKASAAYDKETQKQWEQIKEGAIITDVLLAPGTGLGKTTAKILASGASGGEAITRTILDVWNPIYPFVGDRTLQRTLARNDYIKEKTNK